MSPAINALRNASDPTFKPLMLKMCLRANDKNKALTLCPCSSIRLLYVPKEQQVLPSSITMDKLKHTAINALSICIVS